VQFNLSKSVPSSSSPSPVSSGVLLATDTSSAAELSYISYLRQYQKVYTAGEFQRRFSVFSANIALIDSHNADLSSTHRLGVTEHADWTEAEFRQYRLGYRRPANTLQSASGCNAAIYSSAVPSASFDWRSSNAVGAVKNQGQCGACWSFAATGSVEGLWAIRNKQLLSLSEQQLLDCSGNEGNEGCSGGYTSSALQYIVDNAGLCSEAQYSYIGYPDTQCHDECTSIASIDGHTCVPALNETALLQAITVQPIAVAIEADQAIFQHYTGGVIDDAKCGQQLDHAVLIIGYGTDTTTGQQYYIVKNSWGSGWGINGYALVARNKNMCGIASEPVMPIITASKTTKTE